jgi:hypothetical protein
MAAIGSIPSLDRLAVPGRTETVGHDSAHNCNGKGPVVRAAGNLRSDSRAISNARIDPTTTPGQSDGASKQHPRSTTALRSALSLRDYLKAL